MEIKVLYSMDIPENIKIPVQHMSEFEWDDRNGSEEWVEKEFNYRLNNCSDVFYAIMGDQVVGHIGLKDDQQVQSIFVDEKFRGNGVATAIYEYVFGVFDTVTSDSAREQTGTNIWKKLKKKYPRQIKYDSKLDVFIYSTGSQ